jgi:translation initiation factor IF-2
MFLRASSIETESSLNGRAAMVQAPTSGAVSAIRSSVRKNRSPISVEDVGSIRHTARIA